MIWIGIAVVLGTFWLIYKNYEARLVLFLSGMLMTLIGISFGGSTIGFPQAIDAFVKQFVNGGLVPTYTTVMGFGYVMSYTKCADHLVNALVRPLAKVPMLVIPGAVVITWVLNISSCQRDHVVDGFELGIVKPLCSVSMFLTMEAITTKPQLMFPR